MLQADYEKLPSFTVPDHVYGSSGTLKTTLGDIMIYRFDDASIGLWWIPGGTLHKAVMPIVDRRAEWNTTGKFWFIEAEKAEQVFADIKAI